MLMSVCMCSGWNDVCVCSGLGVAGQTAVRRLLDNTYCNAVYNWLSAEVLAGQTPSERSDLYSYCVIVWEMMHGQCCSLRSR